MPVGTEARRREREVWMDATQDSAAQPEARIIEGRLAWHQALRELLLDPGAQVCMYSDDYAEWPLDESVLVQGLARWALPRRRPCMRMLARDYSKLLAGNSRFVRWREAFSHVIQCRELSSGIEPPPEGLWLGERALVALPAQRERRALLQAGRDCQGSLQMFEQAWDLAEPGFAPRALGL
jgi:hypothetical protein